jgi:hypothetical protein
MGAAKFQSSARCPEAVRNGGTLYTKHSFMVSWHISTLLIGVASENADIFYIRNGDCNSVYCSDPNSKKSCNFESVK